MPISMDKQITINGITFSLRQAIESPDSYMPMITPLFRASTLRYKERELYNYDAYVGRLFYLCYYKKGLAADNSGSATVTRERRTRVSRTTRQVAENQLSDENKILNVLGIDIIKRNPKISKVLFKNSGNQYKMKTEEIDAFITSIKSKPKFKRNKLDLSFGVELEFIGTCGRIDVFNRKMYDLVGEDRYDCLLRYNHNDGKKWVLGTDGSLHATGCGERGYELTSPIYKVYSDEDMEELNSVLSLIKEVFDGHTNRSCGTHIHMSFNCGMTKDDKKKLISHFGHAYASSEESMFDKVVPARRRGNNSRWCRSMKYFYSGQRYQKLNFTNDNRNSSIFHIEFRQLDGTLDYNKIRSWIKLQTLFVELTMNSYKKFVDSDSYPEGIKIEDAVLDKSFNTADIESLLTEGKIAA